MGYFFALFVLRGNESLPLYTNQNQTNYMATKVTFQLSANIVADATAGILVGEFNNWDFENGISLKKQKDGSLQTTLDLEPGIYQYRYFLNDGRWVNDDRAEQYNFVSEYQVDNCVVNVAETPAKASAKPKAVKEAPVTGPAIEEVPKATAKPKTKAAAKQAPTPAVEGTPVETAVPKAKKAAKKIS